MTIQSSDQDAGALWHPWSHGATSSKLFIVEGSGYRLWDRQGREYIDAQSGALNAHLGHGDLRLAQAAQRQMTRLAHFDLSVGTHEPANRLARALGALMPGPHPRWTGFVNSGSEATELAIKVAHDYWSNVGAPRRRVVSLANGYHGTTTLAKALTGLPGNTSEIVPSFPIARVTLPSSPRELRHGSPEPLLAAFADNLRDGQAAAVIVEPFLNVGGGIVLPAGFLRGLRRLCDETRTLLIVDEVFCGLGRTGRMFGFEHEGVVPDIVTNSKGLAAGYMPIGAVTCSRAIRESFDLPGASGALRYGHTTGGHAVACAVALEALSIIDEQQLWANAAARGAQLLDGLTAAISVPEVVDIRGLGLTASLELAIESEATRVVELGLEEGLIVRRQGRHVMVMPPLIVDEAGITEIVSKLTAAVRRASGDRAKP